MSGPNEPRRMTPRSNSDDARVFDNATGNAGRDGYTRIARRQPRGRPSDNQGPFGMSMGTSDGFNPPVGERDWNRGPRFSED